MQIRVFNPECYQSFWATRPLESLRPGDGFECDLEELYDGRCRVEVSVDGVPVAEWDY